jgi:hypothetical protein
MMVLVTLLSSRSRCRTSRPVLHRKQHRALPLAEGDMPNRALLSVPQECLPQTGVYYEIGVYRKPKIYGRIRIAVILP